MNPHQNFCTATTSCDRSAATSAHCVCCKEPGGGVGDAALRRAESQHRVQRVFCTCKALVHRLMIRRKMIRGLEISVRGRVS